MMQACGGLDQKEESEKEEDEKQEGEQSEEFD